MNEKLNFNIFFFKNCTDCTNVFENCTDFLKKCTDCKDLFFSKIVRIVRIFFENCTDCTNFF